MMTAVGCRLGTYRLDFDARGKLRQLWHESTPPLLFESPAKVDFGDNRVFEVGGWDECFPTLDPWSGRPPMGELCWEKPRMTVDPYQIELLWTLPGFQAQRLLTPSTGGSLTNSFTVTNTGREEIPFLWADHALFPLQGLVGLSLPGEKLSDAFDLDGSETKVFAPWKAQGLTLTYQTHAIHLQSDQPWWGIWLNRGGWPVGQDQPLGCVGVEATNQPGEVPGAARLAPGASFSGKVVMSLWK